jgi:hypothetical protein
MQMPLTGEGNAGANGGGAGDLYVFFNVAAHPLFEREGADLYTRCRSRTPSRSRRHGPGPTLSATRRRSRYPRDANRNQFPRIEAGNAGHPLAHQRERRSACHRDGTNAEERCPDRERRLWKSWLSCAVSGRAKLLRSRKCI